MKKLLYYFVCFLCCSIGLYSCSNDDEASIEPQISITGSDDYFLKGVTFTSNTGEETLSFISNVDWAITVANTANGEKWCTVTPNSGKAGENAVKIKVDANDGVDDRSVSLTLRAGELTKTILVTQKQKDALTLTSNKFEVAKNGGTINIEVKSNVDFEVIIPENCKNWITQSAKTRGLSTHNLSFNIAPSEEYDKREGEIIIQSGKLSETVHVYQTGEGTLLLTKNEFSVSDRGEDIVVEVKSNFDFDVKMPNVDWVKEAAKTRGMSSHTLYYTIAKNESYDSREAEIIYYDKNSDVADTLKIIQMHKDAIILSQKNIEIDAKGGEFEVVLEANTNFEIQLPFNVNWITERAITRGLIKHKRYFAIKENTEYNERKAQIVFKNTENMVADTLIVRQVAAKLNINIEEAGTLSSIIGDKLKYKIKELVISGYINGDDIRFIRDMELGTLYIPGELRVLDLSSANIVSGGGSYFTSATGVYTTRNNIIGKCMFYQCSRLTTIHLPDNITSIEESAFSGCRGLTSIDIPRHVTNIGSEAFAYTSIKEINIPEGVTFIGQNAFANSLLSSVVIPQSMTRIAYYAFGHCSSLTNVTIPNSVTRIEDCAFYRCSSLSNIIIPNSITHIGVGAFSGCTNLVDITVPNSVTDIGVGAFEDCIKLESIIIPDNVKTISQELFKNCTTLTNVVIPNNVTAIHFGAFSGCVKLTDIIIPNNVTVIANQAFYECLTLKSISIGEHVTKIGILAFGNTEISEVYSYTAIPPSLGLDCFNNIDKSRAKLYVPQGAKDRYGSSDWGSVFDNVIELDR